MWTWALDFIYDKMESREAYVVLGSKAGGHVVSAGFWSGLWKSWRWGSSIAISLVFPWFLQSQEIWRVLSLSLGCTLLILIFKVCLVLIRKVVFHACTPQIRTLSIAGPLPSPIPCWVPNMEGSFRVLFSWIVHLLCLLRMVLEHLLAYL